MWQGLYLVTCALVVSLLALSDGPATAEGPAGPCGPWFHCEDFCPHDIALYCETLQPIPPECALTDYGCIGEKGDPDLVPCDPEWEVKVWCVSTEVR